MLILNVEAPRVGSLPSGTDDRITDVSGVTVGHTTLSDGEVQTGVTVIKPHARDDFLFKTPAAAAVINGFGKSIGLIQLQELGVLETPIALTNTFSVGDVATAQIRQAISRNPQIGRDWPTVNPLVFECNDGYLNDIQAFAVSGNDYLQACGNAAPEFAQGSVGAGRGMSCFSMKGGVGSASRIASLSNGENFAVGTLVLANFGRLPNLAVGGRALGRYINDENRLPSVGASCIEPEKGSVIIVLATDAPLDARQLQRVAKRGAAGLARTGSVYGHGSGDIALAFTTAYQLAAMPDDAPTAIALLHEALIDPLFEAAAEATEQAIINALWAATTVVGRAGQQRLAITEVLPEWRGFFERKFL